MINEKYLTPWFQVETKPAFAGVYEITYAVVGLGILESYSFWDGGIWYQSCDLIDAAVLMQATKPDLIRQWRGLDGMKILADIPNLVSMEDPLLIESRRQSMEHHRVLAKALEFSNNLREKNDQSLD